MNYDTVQLILKQQNKHNLTFWNYYYLSKQFSQLRLEDFSEKVMNDLTYILVNHSKTEKECVMHDWIFLKFVDF